MSPNDKTKQKRLDGTELDKEKSESETKKGLDSIVEEESWSDWQYSGTVWNFNVGKNARAGAHGIEFDEEEAKYHTGKREIHEKTSFAGKLVPHLIRKLIHKYSEEKDIVLDLFAGSGTIPLECKVNGRKCVAFDINKKSVELTKKKLKNYESVPSKEDRNLDFTETDFRVEQGDALNKVKNLDNNSVDLILTHPPYLDLVEYTNREGDLSGLKLKEFLQKMEKILLECKRVLREDKFCIFIMGDVRKAGIVPLPSFLEIIGLEMGFNIWDDIIYQVNFGGKQVNNFRMIRSQQYKFHLTDHDHVLVFKDRDKGWSFSDFKDILTK